MKKILEALKARMRDSYDAHLIREFAVVAQIVQEQAQEALGTWKERPQDQYAASAPLGELALRLAKGSYDQLPTKEQTR